MLILISTTAAVSFFFIETMEINHIQATDSGQCNKPHQVFGGPVIGMIPVQNPVTS